MKSNVFYKIIFVSIFAFTIIVILMTRMNIDSMEKFHGKPVSARVIVHYQDGETETFEIKCYSKSIRLEEGDLKYLPINASMVYEQYSSIRSFVKSFEVTEMEELRTN